MPAILKLASNYLSRMWNRQLLVFFFFLALSAVFWVFMAGKEVKEAEVDVQLELVGVPANVVITTEPPKKITVTLRDEVFTLMNYKLNKQKNFKAVINWSDVQNSDGHVKLQTNAVLKAFYKTLHSTTQVIGARPETIEFYYNHGLSKKVDVVLQGIIQADSLFSIIASDINPRKITVYGSRSILDTVTGAYLRPVDMRGLKESETVDVYFQPVKGLKYVPNKVRLTVFADRMMEKTVQVPVHGVNFPAGKVLRTFPPKVNVTYQVGTSLDQKIGADAFTIVLNYEELKATDGNRAELHLKSTPTGVQHARITPNEVEFIIEEEHGSDGTDSNDN